MKTRLLVTGLVCTSIVGALVLGYVAGVRSDDPRVDAGEVTAAAHVAGLDFTVAETESLLTDVNDYITAYDELRAVRVPNHIPPALVFNPVPVGASYQGDDTPIALSPARLSDAPEDLAALAFASVRDLGELLRTRKVTSTDLTKMFLERLRNYGPELECVITITEERALESAARADAEIAAGNYRGPLHGIPYGAKDLLAVAGYKTTWGAMPYRDQVLDETAAVVEKLDEAGAVLVAKLTLGALAWGDVWYGGTTRNPWNLEQGSSGSSAGSASATAAGLVPFAIGTETWGSIVSPSTRCGTTGLRPTYGRVSRTGAMALSWSMDKIGPICRNVEDCAIVFDAIRGEDGVDQTLVNAPFNYDYRTDITRLRVGFVAELFEEDYPNKHADNATLDQLRALGVDLIPVKLPELPVGALPLILTVESAAAFDQLTLSGRDDELVRQIKNAWPNTFRAARLVPAVEYIQANRVRYLLIQEMEKLGVDVYITPSFGGNNLLLTNLTGHPCVVLPNGFNEEGSPVSITFMGKLFGEAEVLAVARAYQNATDFHERHPKRFQ